MNIDFKLPELGENITSGDVVNVLVREGDQIVGNQPVIELETDKAVIELPCPHAGRVVKIHVAKGQRIQVGQAIIAVEPEGAASTAKGPAPAKPEAQKPTAAPPTPAAPVAAPAAAAPAPADTSALPAGPQARRLARELGVDLRGVQGSGQRGRITPEDVHAAATQPQGRRGLRPVPDGPERYPSVVVEPVVPPGEEGSDTWGTVRRERMSQIRRTIAARMSQSARTIPHLTNFDDADITELDRLRKGVPEGYLGPNLKLTAMPLVMKAVALALRRHPVLNASVDEENEQVVYKQYVNLGVAVDTPRGLVVPVVRNTDRMTLGELARALAEVAEKARTARFAIEDMRGGTFTISNLGAVGGTYSTPIINLPEVAILLLGRSRWLPVVRDGQVEPRYMLPLSLSYDHRLVDGAAAARFLNEVIGYLQSPGKLLLTG